MDEFRKEVIRELEKKLGDGYDIFPKDNTKNNGFTAHGIFIHKKDNPIGAVAYLDGYIILYAAGVMTPENIAAELTRQCSGERIPIPQSEINDLENFGRMQDKLRLRLINYAANSAELEKIPHRKFLDLAVTYYLDIDMEPGEGNGALIIPNGLMEIWDATEEDLYRAGMENLRRKDKCFAVDMPSFIRGAVSAEDEEEMRAVLDEIEKEGAPRVEMYVASNQKHRFGAVCMLDSSLLQQMAYSKGCDLNIYPSCIDELIIVPVKDGNEDCMSTEDVCEINMCNVPKEEWLSNSIYRYDRVTREVSIYKEGAPL